MKVVLPAPFGPARRTRVGMEGRLRRSEAVDDRIPLALVVLELNSRTLAPVVSAAKTRLAGGWLGYG
jgi:hypothetical protein